MKIFVMVDMEGISGICRKSQVCSPDGEHYQNSRKYLTWDVNACVEGCFQGGATKVVVRDAHSSGYHFIWEELDPRGEYIQGAVETERIPSIGNFDGLILLGYHAMGGTPLAVLEHTMSSLSWQNFQMNGEKVGELAIDAGIAGDNGTPTIMVSGDDLLCKEAAFLKGAVKVEVKKALGCQAAQLLSKEEAHRRITEGAAKAVKNCKKIKPYKVKAPVSFRLELVSRGKPPRRPYTKIIDGRTYEVTGKTVEDALNLLS